MGRVPPQRAPAGTCSPFIRKQSVVSSAPSPIVTPAWTWAPGARVTLLPRVEVVRLEGAVLQVALDGAGLVERAVVADDDELPLRHTAAVVENPAGRSGAHSPQDHVDEQRAGEGREMGGRGHSGSVRGATSRARRSSRTARARA